MKIFKIFENGNHVNTIQATSEEYIANMYNEYEEIVSEKKLYKDTVSNSILLLESSNVHDAVETGVLIELTTQEVKEYKEKAWRDKQLLNTDWIVSVTDHPQHAAYLIYRQALRDWPSTPEFPSVRPIIGGL